MTRTAPLQMADEDALAAALPLEGRDVLDVGCGGGRIVRFLRARGARATGVECAPQQLAAAREADPGHADDYVEGVAQDLPFADRSFGAVVFMFSLHHVPEDSMQAALAEAARVVRPGGHVYVAEPVAGGPGFEVERLIDDETHVREMAQRALAAADRHGLETVAHGAYMERETYGDVEAYIASMVGVDPARRAACVRNANAIRQAFERHGRNTREGVAFDYEVKTLLLRRN